MISYSKAYKITESEFRKLNLKTETVKLNDALNRIIAENIYSDTDQPIFTNSAMDGYAVKSNGNIYTWKIKGEISAGSSNNPIVKTGEAVLIMTGSKLPRGADTVIPVENAIVKDNILYLKNIKSFKAANNIRYKGEDIKKGKLLISKNTLITSKCITAAATCGKSKIKVYKKLKIGILTTGNELVDINKIPKGNKIRASNLYSLHSAINEINMTPVSFGIVKDNLSLLKKKAVNALNSDVDILLTTGGVSAGKYDYLKEIFTLLGIKIKFHKVNIKPGKPLLFGIYTARGKHILVFGLPGNPVSCYVNFILFVKNVLLNIMAPKINNTFTATLNCTVTKKDSKRNFLRSCLYNLGGLNYVSVIKNQSSANIGSLSGSNCLLIFEENKKTLKKGSKVHCIMI
ncbi:MAG: molybdopterin molybdotransferase MoeA [Ignavibacteria bacterium]|nr:molybdopterin molybdotransferase MoeA [Ignavibacteria bacterium]